MSTLNRGGAYARPSRMPRPEACTWAALDAISAAIRRRRVVRQAVQSAAVVCEAISATRGQR